MWQVKSLLVPPGFSYIMPQGVAIICFNSGRIEDLTTSSDTFEFMKCQSNFGQRERHIQKCAWRIEFCFNSVARIWELERSDVSLEGEARAGEFTFSFFLFFKGVVSYSPSWPLTYVAEDDFGPPNPPASSFQVSGLQVSVITPGFRASYWRDLLFELEYGRKGSLEITQSFKTQFLVATYDVLMLCREVVYGPGQAWERCDFNPLLL